MSNLILEKGDLVSVWVAEGTKEISGTFDSTTPQGEYVLRLLKDKGSKLIIIGTFLTMTLIKEG